MTRPYVVDLLADLDIDPQRPVTHRDGTPVTDEEALVVITATAAEWSEPIRREKEAHA